MTHIPTEDEIRQAYAPLNADHDRLRDELLAKLPERVVRRGPFVRIRNTKWLAIAAAICIVVPLVAWLTHVGIAPRRAFALEGVHERLLKVRSLHVKGWSYSPLSDDGTGRKLTVKFPIEWYVERPSREWQTTLGMYHEKSGVRLECGQTAIDGDRRVHVLSDAKEWIISEHDPVATEVWVERSLQSQWSQQLVSGPTTDYRAVGTEKIGSVESLKFERIVSDSFGRTRDVIWLNLASGLPVRVATFEIDKEGTESPSRVYEEIAINVPPAPYMFPEDSPKGYTVRRAEKAGEKGPVDPYVAETARAGEYYFGSRCSFFVDNLAIVICWHHRAERMRPEDPEPVPLVPRFESGDEATAQEWEMHPLGDQMIEDHVWHWSLVVPRDRRAVNAKDSVRLTFVRQKGLQSILNATPIRFADDKLATILSRMVSVDSEHPPQASLSELLTPAKLREKAAEILAKPTGGPRG